MSTVGSAGNTRVLLSFSSAYTPLAHRVAKALTEAKIEVRYDQWNGGASEPATASIPNSVDDVAFVLTLLTPSGAAKTWIGDEWIGTIYHAALDRHIDVLPLRGDGELDTIPEFLRHRSFADLRDADYDSEVRRLPSGADCSGSRERVGAAHCGRRADSDDARWAVL